MTEITSFAKAKIVGNLLVTILCDPHELRYNEWNNSSKNAIITLSIKYWRPNPCKQLQDMVAKSVQSKELLVRVYFGRSYLETGMGIPHGVYRIWLGAFCYLYDPS